MNDNENTEKKEKKKFNLFDWYYKQGKDSDKLDFNALKDPSIINFFKLVGKKINKLLSANLIFIFTNFPIVFVLIAMSGVFSEPSVAPLYQAWGPLYGAQTFQNNNLTSALTGIYEIRTNVTPITTPTLIFFGLGLLMLFTWGFSKVGTTYIYRNLMSSEAVFPFSDFFYIIKRNKKQSILFGIFDLLVLGIISYNSYFLFMNYSASSANPIMLFMTVALLILYLFARPYAYIMIFTFDLKLTKIIKNALYFTVLGIKRNLMVLLGSIILIILNLALFALFMPLGILLPFIITISILDFMGVYAAYPCIIKYMMDEEDAKNVIEGVHSEE